MQANIHPQYNKVKLVFPNGDTMDIYSTYSKSSEIHLDVHYKGRWDQGQVVVNTKDKRISDFFGRYGGEFDFAAGGNKPDEKSDSGAK